MWAVFHTLATRHGDGQYLASVKLDILPDVGKFVYVNGRLRQVVGQEWHISGAKTFEHDDIVLRPPYVIVKVK